MYSCLLITYLLIEKSSRLYIDFAFRRVYNLGDWTAARPPSRRTRLLLGVAGSFFMRLYS